jgi:hypothetical protein
MLTVTVKFFKDCIMPLPFNTVIPGLVRSVAILALLVATLQACAQAVPSLPTVPSVPGQRNSSSTRYEVNQTFDGLSYRKDNNIWVFDAKFAQIFGMPVSGIGELAGATAAAFRVETSSLQECGQAGQAEACKSLQFCYLDLYFDEDRTPLPWATPLRGQTFPRDVSLGRLRPQVPAERPQGFIHADAPANIRANRAVKSPLFAFADPVSKVEALFTTNAHHDVGGEDSSSGALPLVGYLRDFYRNISVVNLQFPCTAPARTKINVRLIAHEAAIAGDAIARFHRITLPEAFGARIRELLAQRVVAQAVISPQVSPQVSASPSKNADSSRHEVNQTFDGAAFVKDNNIWIYDSKFAQTFGMSASGIGDLQGASAAAFRTETTSFEDCGFAGRADACRKLEYCFLDLYFDEDKTQLPWATPDRALWHRSEKSLRFLRPQSFSERRHGWTQSDPPSGIRPNKVGRSILFPFADSAAQVEAFFTTNANQDVGGDDATSGQLAILGFSRKFYRNMSMVSLQFGCSPPARTRINIRFTASEESLYAEPMAGSVRITLPQAFGVRIKETLALKSASNAKFFRDALTRPTPAPRLDP